MDPGLERTFKCSFFQLRNATVRHVLLAGTHLLMTLYCIHPFQLDQTPTAAPRISLGFCGTNCSRFNNYVYVSQIIYAPCFDEGKWWLQCDLFAGGGEECATAFAKLSTSSTPSWVLSVLFGEVLCDVSRRTDKHEARPLNSALPRTRWVLLQFRQTRIPIKLWVMAVKLNSTKHHAGMGDLGGYNLLKNIILS